ncbi:MAG: lactonase family protein [Chloroflexi bacterium]|nr:lactonase family protein [Chloroflexota bacterium]
MKVFVGTYTRTGGDGVYVLDMDDETGELSHSSSVSGATNPSFVAIHPSGKYLYAVAEVGNQGGEPGGAAYAYSIDQDSAALTEINSQSTGSDGPCHLAVDATGKYLCVANYGGGAVTMFPLNDDGSLEPRSDFHQHTGRSVNQQRQRSEHAHSINLDPTNKWAFTPDLGMDKIMTYKLDLENGKLLPGDPAFTETTHGEGPRHFDYHPNGELAFVINELGCTIVSYRFDSSAGTLTEIQSVTTLPDDWTGGGNTTADVHVSPDGRFVYGSNRGHDSLAIYSVDQASGEMTYVGHQSTGGKTPRNFGIAPSGKILLAANQDSDNIVVFKRDVESGTLEPTGAEIDVPMPVCLKFFDVQSE